MEYLIGAFVGIAAFVAFGVGCMRYAEKANAPARELAARHAAAERAQRLKDEASLITARTTLRVISERAKAEPMAAKLAIKAIGQIDQLQGEPTILDELLATKPKRT